MTEFQQSHGLPNNSSDKLSHVIWHCFVSAGTKSFPELSADGCMTDAPLLQGQRGCLYLTRWWRKEHSCLLRGQRTKMNETDPVYTISLPVSAECPNYRPLGRAESGSLAEVRLSPFPGLLAGRCSWQHGHMDLVTCGPSSVAGA